jgi:hypothetical protein
MDLPVVLKTVTGISTAIGLLALLGYLFFLLQARRAEGSVRSLVEGEGIVRGDAVVQLLSQFQDDQKRLEALTTLLNFDGAKARDILEKVKANVDVGKLNKQETLVREKHLLIVAGVFLVLAILGTLAQRQQPSQPQVSPEVPRTDGLPRVQLAQVEVKNDAGLEIRFLDDEGQTHVLPRTGSTTLDARQPEFILKLWSCGLKGALPCDYLPYAVRAGDKWHVVMTEEYPRIELREQAGT